MTPASQSELAVGIDIGTTSVKAVAADPDGNVVARSRVPHRVVINNPDTFEHDAGQAWRRGPRKALAALKTEGVAAISVTGMVPSLCAVDRRGMNRSSARVAPELWTCIFSVIPESSATCGETGNTVSTKFKSLRHSPRRSPTLSTR